MFSFNKDKLIMSLRNFTKNLKEKEKLRRKIKFSGQQLCYTNGTNHKELNQDQIVVLI